MLAHSRNQGVVVVALCFGLVLFCTGRRANIDLHSGLEKGASKGSIQNDLESCSVDLVGGASQLLSFLKESHVRSFGQFYNGSSPSVLCAVRRYETQWIPLLRNVSLRRDVDTMGLVPPLDVAWVWHIHRLKPQSYAKYLNVIGDIDENKFDGSFKWQASTSEHSSGDGDDAEATRQLWHNLYDDSPFFVDAVNGKTPCGDDVTPASFLQLSQDAQALPKGSERQSWFLYQMLQPNYEDRQFLEMSKDRYVKFLGLRRLNPKDILVPTYPVDLMWHTHILSPFATYQKDVKRITGLAYFPHDDSKMNYFTEAATALLQDNYKTTEKLWHEAYGDLPYTIGDKMRGGYFRGPPPEEYFEGSLPDASFLELSDGNRRRRSGGGGGGCGGGGGGGGCGGCSSAACSGGGCAGSCGASCGR